MDEFGKTVQSFTKKYIKMPQDWLRECIDFFKHQDNSKANYTQDDLEQFVYMQWLLFDIREMNVPVLPAKIKEEKKYELNDTITLQLLSVVDISRSKYSQIQKIRYKLEKPLESDVKEFEYKDSSKRCLQLTLTDGNQNVQAFEYKLLNNLSLNLKPGMKIRFIAPTMIRYGQIMLQSENNILLLGGEVEDILISNAPENVLAAALKLPLNNNPGKVENNIQNENNNRTAITSNSKTNQENVMNRFLNKAQPTTKISNNSEPRNNKVKTIVEDDEFDMLMEIENELHGAQNTNIIPVNKPKIEKLKSSGQSYEENIEYMLNLEDEIKNERTTPIIQSSSIKSIPLSKNNKEQKMSKYTANVKYDNQKNSMEESFGNSSDLNTNRAQNKNSIPTNKAKVEKLKSSGQSYEENIEYMLNLEDEINNERTTSINESVPIKNKPVLSNKMSKYTADINSDNQKSSLDESFGINSDLKSKMSKRIESLSTTEDIADVMKKYKPFKTSPKVIEILSSPDESPKKKQRLVKDAYINPVPSTSRQIFKNIEEPKKSIPISKVTPTKPQQISPAKFMSLSTLSKTQITSGKFKVNAKFKKVLEKLTLKDEKWYIKLQIEDSSGTLDTTVDNELIDKLIGYTYAELKVFAQKGGQQFKEALDTFKAKLQKMDGVLVISFVNKVPKITNIL